MICPHVSMCGTLQILNGVDLFEEWRDKLPTSSFEYWDEFKQCKLLYNDSDDGGKCRKSDQKHCKRLCYLDGRRAQVISQLIIEFQSLQYVIKLDFFRLDVIKSLSCTSLIEIIEFHLS